MSSPANEMLLEVRNLVKHFPVRRGLLKKVVGQVRAVDGVSFSVGSGETLALVGETGSGKTTTGRCVLRLIEPTRGQLPRGNGVTWSHPAYANRHIFIRNDTELVCASLAAD